MTININSYGTTHIIAPIGKIDTNTAPELKAAIDALPDSAKELILDFTGVDYISSAGLHVLVQAQNKMEGKDGSIKITNVNQIVDEIFEITGFGDLLPIEK